MKGWRPVFFRRCSDEGDDTTRTPGHYPRYGETDDFSYNIVKDVHVRGFTATLLHHFGFDHERCSYGFQGLDQRLAGVEPERVVSEILA